MTAFTIMRRIGIDAGHRLPLHNSKCKHLHGHRYEIEAKCQSLTDEVIDEGEQAGMVLDFGFLKEEMECHIDAFCDHGLILSLKDTEALSLFAPDGMDTDQWIEELSKDVKDKGHSFRNDAKMNTKLYVIADYPTAENLAKHWFERLAKAVTKRSNKQAKLTLVRVWETPNCFAEYRV
jgi:6-pyruvoyltetrahydropterin/6-carboxytetrahydropterin synthase